MLGDVDEQVSPYSERVLDLATSARLANVHIRLPHARLVDDTCYADLILTQPE